MADITVTIGGIGPRIPIDPVLPTEQPPGTPIAVTATQEHLHAANVSPLGLDLETIGVTGDPIDSSYLIYEGAWTDWVGVSGGITTGRTKHGSTIDPYDGSPQTIVDALNAAATAGGDRYVELGEGTFNLTGTLQISASHVTLRGQVDSNGVPTTILNFTGGMDGLIYFRTTNWDLTNQSQYTTFNVLSGATRGSHRLVISGNPSTIVDGQFLIISAPNSTEVTGASWALFLNRPFTQIVRVVSHDTNSITFEPAISADYLSATVQVHWRTPGSSVMLSGIENLSLTRSLSVPGHYVRMDGADQCWAKNIKTYGVPAGNYYHFHFYICYRCEVRHCDSAHMGSPLSSTYVIQPVHSSGLLIEDNYFHDCPNVCCMMGMNLSAFCYNYCTDFPYDPNTWLSQIVFAHGAHCHYNLFEGNWVAASYNAAPAPTTNSGSRNHVWFRNRMLGWDATGPKTSNCACLTLTNGATRYVACGNVLGYDPFHTVVLATWSGTGDDASNCIFKVNTASSLVRLANYNTVDDAVPASETLLAGQQLVNSYLHASRPLWFGNLTWPWVSPSNFALANNAQSLPAGYRAAHSGADPPAESYGTVIFSWTAAGGAVEEYVVEVGTTSGGSDVGTYHTGSTETSYALLLATGIAFYARAKAVIGGVIGAASNEATFTV